MKTLYKHLSICLFVLSFLFLSCEDFALGEKFLQKPPGGDVTIDTIFSKAEYAERILWRSYQSLPYRIANGYENSSTLWAGNLEALTDLNQSYLSWDGPSSLYYSGAYNSGNENGNGNSANYGTKYRFTGRDAWPGIRHAWLFIENVDRVPDMDDTVKSRMVAEAKIVIAIHYAEMMRHYGGLPIVDKAIKADDINMPKRATLQETVDFIVQLLDEAIATEDLPWALPEEEVNNWDGRLTKAAAMGLKTRVLLFVASPLFNSDEPYYPGEASDQKMTWFGGYDSKKWEEAAQAGKEFFEAQSKYGRYKLFGEGEPRMAFRDAYYTRGTSESLISVRRRFKSHNFLMQVTRWGASCPTKEYFDMFPMADGSEFDWNNPVHAKNPFVNRDPRLYETILIDGDMFGGEPAEINKAKTGDNNYPKGKHWGFKNYLDVVSLSSGLPLRKFVLDRQGEYKQRIIHWPYLRLAEVYLNYAEALNECGQTANAYQYVNAVRNRVGLKGLPANLTKEQLREAILKERACEFGWEEVRFFDLIRWKREADFTKPLHGIDLYKHKETHEYLIEVKKLKVRAWQKEGGFSPKWYLSAFPSKEVDKGYGLVQNPGWE